MKSSKFSKSYDIVGNIAVIDSNPKYAKKLAAQVMKTNKNVETVLRKGGAISGEFRTRKHIYVAGKRNYVAEYKENGCTFKVDLRKCFFSTRLAFERQRITNLAKDGESVLVMFSGVGPFAIEIAKKNKRSRVIGVELNADAHEYALKNIALNKTPNVTAINADVKEFAKRNKAIADRIIMPLPMDASNFLDCVYKTAKDGCTVHYYAFGDTDTVSADECKRLEDYFSKLSSSIKVIGIRKVRPYSSHSIEIAIDFILHKNAAK